MNHSVSEFAELDALLAGGGFTSETLAEVDVGRRLPIIALRLGSADPAAPLLGVFGGVHGLERIGAAVVLTWLRQLQARLAWDDALLAILQRVQLIAVPIVNPGGLLRGTRANPAGVDLMRNAPIDADMPVPRLIGGHRIGPWLPWYRGTADQPMQPEAAALCRLLLRELAGRPFALTLDCHSGFGMRDRIWFPYACTRSPLPCLPELHAMMALFEASHPHHAYLCEPQCRQYLAHGDLWDYLHRQSPLAGERFLPLTLEMGSWLWVRKNPRQLLSRQGLFNPLIAHRHRRVLRRHLPWFDFLLRATAYHPRWLPTAAEREAQAQRALQRWYR